MKYSYSIIIPILTIALVNTYCIRSEQLSTVFVLETSDSSSDSNGEATGQKTPEASSKLTEDPNTRVITDEGPPTPAKVESQQSDSQVVVVRHHANPPAVHAASTHQVADHTASAHQTPSNTGNANHSPNHTTVHNNHSAHNRSTSPHNASHHNNVTNHPVAQHHQTEPKPTSRRLEEESNLVAQRSVPATRNIQQPQHQHVTSAPVRHKSTTTAPSNEGGYEDRDSNVAATSTTPKTEERLLISITSEDDDGYKPPQKQLGLQGGQLSVGGQNLVAEAPHKRKPSITISIQDANINKQNGGSSGTPSVILRPSENGQSIVISTVGGSSSIEQGNSHKYQPNKPQSIAIVSSNSFNQSPPPYREPVNSNSLHNHYLTSSTSRPVTLDEDSLNSRPITSTLIDPPRPNVLVTDERPQRPALVSEETNLDYGVGQSRPTPRPVIRPVTQEPSGYNEQDYTNRPVSGSLPQEPKYPLSDKNCGTVHETRIVGGEEADPGDFLWMAAIIKSKPNQGDQRPFCGGSLITRRHILTAAHCLENLAPRDVLVRLGSYDFDDSTASSLSADFAIDQFRVPAQYSKKTHAADIAIMRLKTPISPTDNYKTVCMPQPRRSYVGALGTVTGYGSQSQTFRRAAPKLRQVTVPIWENRKCSVVYKKNLNESFLCAGYEEGGKDACQGDSGGPLMTEGPNERMMIVGVVSHGIGCGSPGYPGVYTRTTTYLDWIEKNTKE